MVVNRRLVAVVFADVAGYSRLMERDEVGTHERLHALLQDLIVPSIACHGGRTVHSAGDGMLLEFPSTTSALRWAVEFQRTMRQRNCDEPPESRIEFRIGINPGDVIVDGSDIFGDDVNVASRLEMLATPGGICVAAAVPEQVHEDLGIGFVDGGDKHVKNISRPVRVYHVVDRRATETPPWRAMLRRGRVRATLGAGALLVATAIGVATWTSSERALPSLEPSPRSIVVAPFGAPPGDAEFAALAAGLGPEVARALANSVRDAKIVVPSGGQGDRGKVPDDRETARRAQVRYVIAADVGAVDDDVVVTVRLADGVTGTQFGSERRALARARLHDDHALLVARITAAARGMFQTAEARRVAANPAAATDPRSVVTRADLIFSGEDRGATITPDRSTMLAARKLYEEARERDPTVVAAWTGHMFTLNWEYWNDFAGGRNLALISEMDRDSRRAIALDERDPTAWYARAAALATQWQWAAALDAIERAVALDPTRARFRLHRSFLFYMSGRPQDALQEIGRSIAAGATDGEYLFYACHAYLHLGQYREALDACRRSAAGNNTYWLYFDLAVAHAQNGDLPAARAAAAELMRRVPDFTIARFEAKRFSDDPEWAEQVRTQFLPALREAGVPEG
jgi:class 3 adenylate cyclase/tetratricopeptide (TPR) repeat protein/TolB-like protein